MKRTFAALCGLAFASLLAGCGSAADNLNFKVPDGFQSKINVLGMVQVWVEGASPDQSMIVLTKLPIKKNVADKGFEPVDLSSTTGIKSDKATIESSKKITICGNQTARLVTMSATASTKKKSANGAGEHMKLEMLLTNVGNNTYMAMYGYPKTEKPNPAAESALKSVCAKPKSTS